MVFYLVFLSSTPSSPTAYFLNIKVLNVLYFRSQTIDRTDYANDIEPIIGDVPVMEIMLDGVAQIVAFLVVDGFCRITEITIATGLHFHEDCGFAVLCNNVDVTMVGMPVAFKDGIAFLTEISRSNLLSPDTRL